MPTFGPYETTRELASGHGSVVYSARKAGDAADQFAVKVFTLEHLLGGPESGSEYDAAVADFNRKFALSVEVQNKAAQSSPHVAPILQSGHDGSIAWYVTRLYPRSIQKILDGRVALGVEWFFHIVSSLARGALDFKKHCGRAHGDIRPSNILISASQKVMDAQVVLSDPLPGGPAEAARYELADLNSIGQIIYQLVRRREVEDASDHSILPLMPSPEWTGIFGQDTGLWLALCNRLLDPNLSLEVCNLEKLVADLEALRPKPPVTGRMIALAAVGVVLLITAGIFSWWFFGRGTILISSRPPGTLIHVMDSAGRPHEGRTGKDGSLRLTIAKGPFVARAEYPGLGSLTNSGDFQSGVTEVPPFVFAYMSVSVDSQPRGAVIRLDGTNVMEGGTPVVTPHTFDALRPGAVTIQVDGKDKGFLPMNLPISLAAGELTNLFATLVVRPINQGTVEFDSVPIGAVFLLNKEIFVTNRLDTKSLPPGNYNFVGRYNDIWPLKETNVIVRANEEAKVKFYFESATISLDSQPQGASVYVSNRWVGVTPTNGFLWPTGVVEFRFEKTGYEIASIRTNIFKDDARVNLNPGLVSTNGIILLDVVSGPAVVFDVLTRAEVLRTTPGKPGAIERLPGRHEFRIEAEGFQPTNISFTFVSKQRTPVSVQMPPELLPVTLSSDPSGAEFYDVAGNALVRHEAVTAVPAGSHRFAASLARYPTLGWVTNNFTVIKGQANASVFRFQYTLLVLTSSPPRAKVYEISADGRTNFLGVADTGSNYIKKPGPITLEFVKDDGTGTNRNREKFIMEPRLQQVGTYFRPPKPPPLTNSVGIVFEWIPRQGTNGGYWVGKFEITQAQYQSVMSTNPSTFKNGDPAKLPVETVSLEDARRFCRELTARDQTYLRQQSSEGWIYALPTDAQWSYFAAKTPLTSAVTSEKGKKLNAANIGSLPGNEFDLHDVRGNVWEWCAEGKFRGAAYNTFTGGLGAKPLDIEYRLTPVANMPAAFNGGFRCVLVPAERNVSQ